MNKSELIKEAALKGKLSFREAGDALDAIIDTITETMQKGENITLVGFGSFVIQERKERNGHNPATGGSMVLSENAMENLRKNGKVVFIDVDLDEIKRRVTNIKTRGIAFGKGETLDDVYRVRYPLYK